MKVIIKYFSQDYDKGCLMLDIKYPLHNKLLKLIDPNDVFQPDDPTKGLEKRPHVTIAYGFTAQDYPKDVFKYVELRNPNDSERIPRVTLISISKFDNEEYDVLKWDVRSPDLTQINATIEANYELENDYKSFKPHCTLAYLKKGTADKYIKKFKDYKNIQPEVIQLAFSNAGEKDDYIYKY